MTKDARFEDVGGGPLRLRALDQGDLDVISAAAQDAVLSVGEMRWERRRRRFALLLNRFRWEEQRPEEPERVRSVLAIEDVTHVASQDIDPADTDTVLSLLRLDWEPGEDGTGRVLLTFAGDGAIAVSVEALEVTLTDVTRPYRAVSGKVPGHRA